MNNLVRIGTRGSALALWQARQAQNMLGIVGLRSELVPISSSGDKALQKPLYEMGVQGIFTKELDAALLEGQIDTKSFKLVFNHTDMFSLDRFQLTLETLSFDEIAECDGSDNSTRVLSLTSQNILDSNVVVEILNCSYLSEFSYATLKLVLEQFTDALLKDNLPVDIFYAEAIDSTDQFEWTNIFLSLDSREEFVEYWKSLEVSKEIQSRLLEQSICQPSKMYRRYKVV